VARNWEEHFAQITERDFSPRPLLVETVENLVPGHALDLACGAGRNALHLACLGWSVVAVDSSPMAIRRLRERAAATKLTVETHLADLEAGAFAIEPGTYDLICDFFYLERSLFPQIREGVRPGGLFVAEIHLRAAEAHQFVLEPGELRALFEDWKIFYYSEVRAASHRRPVAQMVARRA